MAIFAVPLPSNSRRRSASRSTDDHSSNDTPHRLLQPRIPDLAISSQSLESTNSYHDDLPTPSAPTYASHSTSSQSTPMTSPSTGYSSLFPGSLSSATSDSVPSVRSKYRSEFGLLVQSSPIHGSASSRSSQPTSPPSPYTTESDSPTSASHVSRKYSSPRIPRRPSTAPHIPSVLATASSADISATEHHTRSYSRLTLGLKNLLSRPSIPSPSRFSFNSVKTTPPDVQASSRSFHTPVSGSFSSAIPRKSHPPDLHISDARCRYTSEADTKTCNTPTANELQGNLDISLQTFPSSPVHTPKTRNVLRRRPSASAKLFKGRERSVSSPTRPREAGPDQPRSNPKDSTSRQDGPLTAAGAVVEAYKQQDLHRDDVPSPAKLSFDQMSSAASHEGALDAATPYCTLFGSSSHVQVGGPDTLWTKFEADQCHSNVSPSASRQHSGSESGGGGRNIARKVSMRWRKGRAGDMLSEDSPSRHRGHSKGQPTFQELSSTRSTGQSMDVVSNANGSAWSASITNLALSGSEKGDGNEGGKLWRLIRRISTGGLRERFQSNEAVPPVPAIPKELLEKTKHNEHGDEPVSPSSRQPLLQLSCGKELIRSTTAPENISGAPPSVTTATSSANSSNVTSPQFFHKIHSPCSSVSSYGDPVLLSPLPEPTLPRHIIAPLEQLRLGDGHVKSGDSGTSSVRVPRSPRRSTSVPASLRTTEAMGDHVPLPSPLRQTNSGESISSSRPSSASACTSASAKVSSQSQRMTDGTVPLTPPPRPLRSGKRGYSMSLKKVHGDVIGDVRRIDRVPSAQSDTTARPESPESRTSLWSRRPDADHDGVPIRAQLTFRELNAPRRPPLSEREKADIWDDLLARSDQAGGTLHINGATELMSDSLRFSTHSDT